ncbi:transferase spermidine synthase [Massilia arenosa]|uniref:Transferase spermidine synthase n=1 Tax=Zemynaea arenosa TaxID=2561931 RepID=A0A4Y9SRE7_9BURK|nr:fused MFS/spermidine synthase [Massilia arenosa]TFW27804.1 transferase spermidine synthase [Massilia arenosa]
MSHPTAPASPSPAAPLVRTHGHRRTLEFAEGSVQSEMDLRAPDRLVLAYTRAMMLFALFVPRPRHIVMVGLGGGSLVKFCHRWMPQARITVLEVRADVIALRHEFAVPEDDARLRVIHADAVEYLAASREPADVILVDGFDALSMHAPLGSARFLGACRKLLAEGGVLVLNIFSYDPAYRHVLARLTLMFADRVCWFDKVSGNNRILFAVKASPGQPLTPAARTQARVARRAGLGAGFLNRWLVRTLLWTLRRAARQQKSP